VTPSYCNDLNSKRTWELVRWSPSPESGSHANNEVMFHGWTGGAGFHDCGNLYRAFGSETETYYNYFELTLEP
jgi:hypothetical protein